MRPASLSAVALRNLTRHRRRSIVNVVGIGVAVGSVLFFQAFYRGSYEELMFGTLIDFQNAHAQVQAAAFRAEDVDSWGEPPAMIDGWESLCSSISAIEGVQAVSPRLAIPAFAGNGVRKRAILLTGVDLDQDARVFRTLQRLTQGRGPRGPGEIAVGSALARRFELAPGDALRVQVRTIDGVPNIQTFTITGLFATGYAQIDQGTAFVRLEDLRELASAGHRVNRIFVRTASVEEAERVRADIAALSGASRLSVTTWKDAAAGILEHSKGDRQFMVVFLVILLVLSMSMVAGTMSMAVFERTREIGSLRAMGWHRSEIFWLFVIEAGLIGAAGAALGILAGGGVSLLIARFPIELGALSESTDIPFLRVTCRLTVADALVSILAGTAAAAAAGVSPARRAAGMPVTKALGGMRAVLIAAAFTFALVAAPRTHADEKGRAIVAAMDRAMNFAEGRMRIRIEDHKAAGAPRVYRAEVLFVLKQATLIEFIDPPRDRRKRILTVGDSMWMAVPGTSRPIRLSGKDSFMGTSFTNDDVMNLDRSDDYDAVVEGRDPAGTRLVMTALKSSVPYPRVETVVADNGLPVRSVMYTRSGAASKRIEYSEPRDFGDRVRPSMMTVIDLMASGDRSVVVFESMEAGAVDRTRLSPASFGK